MVTLILGWGLYAPLTLLLSLGAVRYVRGPRIDAYVLTNIFQLLYLAHIAGSLLGQTN